MAENTTPELPAKLAGLELGSIVRIPAVRQITLLIGVAAAVAAGAFVFLWAQGPDMRTVYQGLDSTDTAAVVTALESAGIQHQLSADGAAVMVPNKDLARARLELAGQGFAAGAQGGVAMLQEQSSFGVSQFMESARYQHALETELARTIRSIRAVQDSRVHLAVPRQSSFLRARDKPSASVLLTLHRGQRLAQGQAESIVNLVAASVPNLAASDVTVVDQQGTLLSERDPQSTAGMQSSQFDYTRRLEEVYRQRILDLLAPVVGPGRVRAEVVADLDFTVTEQTRESFDPASTTVRSEALNESLNTRGSPAALGIPGALSNQPPEAGGVAAEAAEDSEPPLNRQSSTTRNYEVDKTVSITRVPSGTIRKLSVAVLIDSAPVSVAPVDGEAAEEDTAAPAPAAAPSAEDIERLTTLVRDVIGFDEARGDRVSVIAAPFVAPETAAEADEIPLWKQPDVLALARTLLGVLIVVGIAFGLGRPLLKGLLATAPAPARTSAPAVVAATGEVLPAGTPMPATAGAPNALAGYSYDEKVAAARNITGHDPARVAEVLKKWVASDE